ncbi:MAG TPA: hypothetical protein PLA43_10125 [Bryobacteraceae bacterium]|nr:hypothetical protein [Bryobacteraceae bacterium]HOL72736.1 hypothetical protein [Bryobacteraceae bacterium]HOQ46634.1 hypothetical protein [Bryobacteraceae bacterium]HPQ14573.1 hypothetical protein [Bryobacteraceae bacterium]HPU72304.1 hypothetical protein [Bryobacteraceae bacterium]
MVLAVFLLAASISYDAPTDRKPRPKPPLPALQGANTVIKDPTFGNRILRVTDNHTFPAYPDGVCTTAAASLQNTWNADSTRFTVICSSVVFPFEFDPKTFRVKRMGSRSNRQGGLYLDLKASPAFSFTDPDLIYGIGAGMDGDNTNKLLEYNFRTKKYRTLVDLEKLVPNYEGGAGAVTVAANERISVIFGGMQDTYRYVLFFDKQTGSKRILDTRAAAIDGKPAGFSMNWGIHLANIDKSGRYIIISKGEGGRQPNLVVWDTETDKFAEVAPKGTGHYSTGYGMLVNGNGWWPSWAMWLLRPLDPDRIGTFEKLIDPMLGEDYGGREEHSSWNNARPDAAAPVLVSIARHADAKNPLQPWDDEIVAISTDPKRPTVWRFAHHRSRYNGYFWDDPRGNVSPDGRYFLFTSNWENTLGTSPDNRPRQDVFLLELPLAGAP